MTLESQHVQQDSKKIQKSIADLYGRSTIRYTWGDSVAIVQTLLLVLLKVATTQEKC